MKYTSEEIGKLIKDKRVNTLNWSQETLGKELGISGKQISNYEKGTLTPPIDVLLKLCDIFNCELGYLLGENDYASGTKFNTAMVNSLGLNTDTISSICHLTGNDRTCIHFGYESTDYRRILNSFISAPSFASLIEAIYDLDRSVQHSKKIWTDLEDKYGKDTLETAFAYYNSTTDYLHDENAEKLDDIFYQIMADIDTAIDKSQDASFSSKVFRYEARESFERLLDELYPQK